MRDDAITNLTDIPNYEGHYAASEEGHIYSLKHGKITKLSPSISGNGYMRVQLCMKGKSKGHAVNRLILETFVGSGEGLEGDHIYGIKEDNKLSQLRWLTHAENMIAASQLPVYQKRKVALVGTVIQTGVVLAFDSFADARRAGFPPSNIRRCCDGIKDSHHGVRWRYA